MTEHGYDLKPAHHRRVMLLAIVLFCAAAMLPQPANSESKDDTTGTVSKAEPALRQDGTPSHPFADASECPASTDLIIWPSGRAIPSLPPEISVCIVGNQSFNEGGSDVQVHGR
jgi:hypothetical protein